MEKTANPIADAAKTLALIYSSDDGACLTPDPSFKERQVMDAWTTLRHLLGIADDLK